MSGSYGALNRKYLQLQTQLNALSGGSGSIPTLQQVCDTGNRTSTSIIAGATNNQNAQLNSIGLTINQQLFQPFPLPNIINSNTMTGQNIVIYDSPTNANASISSNDVRVGQATYFGELAPDYMGIGSTSLSSVNFGAALDTSSLQQTYGSFVTPNNHLNFNVIDIDPSDPMSEEQITVQNTLPLQFLDNINIQNGLSDNNKSYGNLGDVLTSTSNAVVWAPPYQSGFISIDPLAGDGPATFTFPTAFPNACNSVMLTPQYDGTISPYFGGLVALVGTPTVTEFQYTWTPSAQAVIGVYWIAFGI